VERHCDAWRPAAGPSGFEGLRAVAVRITSRLFDQTRLGMRVIISPDDAEPVDISHPALLVPDAAVVAAAPERAQTLEREAAEAATLAQETKKAAKAAARAASTVAASIKKLERQKKAADAELASAEKAIAAAKNDKAKSRAEERKIKAAAKAAETEARLATAREEAKAKLDAAASTKEAAAALATRKSDTEKAAREAKLALEPVSVYISRATQMVYVRRNTRQPWPDGGEVYDFALEAPITIRDAELPIGTHIFTAMAPADTGLRWSAVTIDGADSATNALDRITIPEDLLARIAPSALPRSSIIISDEPLSAETNYRTEFVAVLSDEPQGGFKTRRPTPPPVAVYDTWNGGGGGFFGFGYYDNPPPKARYVQPRQRVRRTNPKQGWW